MTFWICVAIVVVVGLVLLAVCALDYWLYLACLRAIERQKGKL